MTSPSCAPQWPTVALFGGPLVEGMGKTVSMVFGTTLHPERGARDLVKRCGDDGTRAQFVGGGGDSPRRSSGSAFL
jgi:hypothetical protein